MNQNLQDTGSYSLTGSPAKVTQDIGDQLFCNRIRILKTGLFGVEKYVDMQVPENRICFEKLATPGTELKLVRDRACPDDPFRINVFSPDGVLLGHVTEGKCQTAARLMDAGFELLALVNESLPFHDSDYNFGITETEGNLGWSNKSRMETGHKHCNLPYCIYLVEGR